MAAPEDPRIGYTHVTSLSDRAHASVSIRSKTLPLELRTVTSHDAPALLRIFSDKENIKHDPSAAGLNTLPAIENVIALWTNLTDPLTRLNLVVVAEGEVVGLSGMGHIHAQDDGKRVGDAGVMINPDARGRGYACDSLRITIDYALRVLQLDEVTVQMREANVEMRGLMEKKFGATQTVSKSPEGGNEYSYRFRREEWLGER